MGARHKAADFVSRDWASFERANAAHWSVLRRTRGANAIVEVADALRHQVIEQRPDWPTAGDRARDLAHHLRLIEILSRVPARGV